MARGYCKKCRTERTFFLVDEQFNLKKWKCQVCGTTQLGALFGD